MNSINELVQFAIQKFHTVVSLLSYNDPTMKPIVSLFVIGIVGIVARIILKKYPRMIYFYIKNKLVYSITIVNDDSASAVNYTAFMKFYEKHRPEKGVRRFRLTVSRNKSVLAADEGLHWFYFEGRYYWFSMREMESSGSEMVKSKVTIYSYGLSIKSLERLVKTFCVKPSEKNGIYTESNRLREPWARNCDLQEITLDDLILPSALREMITSKLDWFMNNREWYQKRFLDYKLNILLEGPPGTGKSYLIKAIANYLERDMYLLNVHKSDDAFNDATRAIPSNGLGIIEDFDDNHSMLKRTDSDGEAVVRKSSGIKLSTMLNYLQGVNSSNGSVTMLSTNHIELLDPAIYRESRIDLPIHVGPMENEQIYQYMARMYSPEQAAEIKEVFLPTTAAALSKFFMSNIDSIDGFRKDLLEHHQAKIALAAA